MRARLPGLALDAAALTAPGGAWARGHEAEDGAELMTFGAAAR